MDYNKIEIFMENIYMKICYYYYLMEQNIYVIFVLGGPGSGKSTQCKMLAKKYELIHISVGDILRNEVNYNRTNANLIKKCITEGLIVPGEITTELLFNECKKYSNKIVLIDGFPRNYDNYMFWKKIAGTIQIIGILFFNCDNNTMINRILNRSKSLENKRIDDNVNILNTRLTIFKNECLPIIELFKKKNLLIEIDCHLSVEKVFTDVVKNMEQLIYSLQNKN